MNLATILVILFGVAFFPLAYWVAKTTEVVPRELQRATGINSAYARANALRGPITFYATVALAIACVVATKGADLDTLEAFLVILLLAEALSVLLTFLTGAFTGSFYALAFFGLVWRSIALAGINYLPTATGVGIAAVMVLIHRALTVYMNKLPAELVEEAAQKKAAKK